MAINEAIENKTSAAYVAAMGPEKAKKKKKAKRRDSEDGEVPESDASMVSEASVDSEG